MPQRQNLSRGMFLLVLLSMGITFYFMLTYTGPFQWLTELQLKWGGQYEEKLTFLFTDLLVLAVLGLPVLIIKKLGLGATATEAGADASASARKTSINWLSEAVIFFLIGVGFAIAGVRAYYIASHAGPLTSIDVQELESGQKPPSLWINAHGIAIPKAAVEFGESYSKDQFIPVLSSQSDPEQTGIHLFLKTRSNDPISGNGRDAADYQGYIERADLPGAVRTIMEKQGVLKGSDYYVLELNVTPQKKMDNARIMFWVGAGLAGLGVIFALAKKLRKPKPAATSSISPTQ